MKRLLAIMTLAAFTLPFAMPAAAAGNGSMKHRKHKKHKRAKPNPNK